MALTEQQLQDILRHDEPTDIWLVDENGNVGAVPDQPVEAFLAPDTWPKYIARSQNIDLIVLSKGYVPALEYVNNIIDNLIVGGSSEAVASKLGRFIGAAVTKRKRRGPTA